MSATQNRPDIRFMKPIEYPWASGAFYTALDVIGAKPKVRDNTLIAIILSFLTMVYWNRNAFGVLDNLSSAPNICGCLLGIAFTFGFVKNPSNVPL
jgi:hypothetical protein